MFHSGLFERLFGPQAPSAGGLGGVFADPRMDPSKPLPTGLVAGPVDDKMLSTEEKLDKYLQEIQAAKKREEMFKLAGLIQSMGQAPSFAPPAAAARVIGAGQPGVARSGAAWRRRPRPRPETSAPRWFKPLTRWNSDMPGLRAAGWRPHDGLVVYVVRRRDGREILF